ncbi:hypothetical protein HYS93_02540 [Candidatus Daviesbacteria bacterium]|nr:hypothetical protein [Candidatus Daviesbacteria bacterium]
MAVKPIGGTFEDLGEIEAELGSIQPAKPAGTPPAASTQAGVVRNFIPLEASPLDVTRSYKETIEGPVTIERGSQPVAFRIGRSGQIELIFGSSTLSDEYRADQARQSINSEGPSATVEPLPGQADREEFEVARAEQRDNNIFGQSAEVLSETATTAAKNTSKAVRWGFFGLFQGYFDVWTEHIAAKAPKKKAEKVENQQAGREQGQPQPEKKKPRLIDPIYWAREAREKFLAALRQQVVQRRQSLNIEGMTVEQQNQAMGATRNVSNEAIEGEYFDLATAFGLAENRKRQKEQEDTAEAEATKPKVDYAQLKFAGERTTTHPTKLPG